MPKPDQTTVTPPRPARAQAQPLAGLARLLGLAPVEGGPVTGVTHDSRAVRPGDVYVAFPGANHHGAAFAAQAAAAGAVAMLTDPAGAELAAGTGLPLLVVDRPRARMGELAAAVYGRPSERLLMIGLTGTNGKTTTSYLVEGGLRGAGRNPGVIGTVEMRVGSERIKSERTTPEATDLHAILAVMGEAGADAVTMEVSSHALVFGRTDGVVYDVALFNNLTPEHLDFHPDMEDYFQAKARLFQPGKSRLGVANLDDQYGRRLVAEAEIPITSFSATGAPEADWRAVDVQLGPVGSTFRVLGPDGAEADAAVPLPGPFNVANALAAITLLVTAGLPLEQAVAGIAAVPGVPGRLERVDAGQPYVAVVDYAHKPDALEAVLGSLREVTKGRLHVVVGCGGDRDPHKRAPMGAIAARLADTALLTSDNPRSEDPLAILATMLTGAASVPESERGAVLVVPDRAEAIHLAVARAQAGDTVLVAGKGHELGQYVRDEIRPFDDREVLRESITQTTAARGDRGVEQQ
ncbi:UDP-N-acetylmuramoyl-L-alanyl-D-glutamate--2,6-diaminopimelate ligase [Streptomyces sp. CB01881]|uniref:UDP-N-acetylmuramoyl-L-alanyl-D-glutamate--2, 6-diaminopimelate ligase n=1 Tax=Streptomyces sp. CB01881 TaxID=2078691 RepID=UPI000CDCB316|nr:UDP-N-acetylmuramoyl-L-alanyl-D-glutamate--2,6-diaminopimelate ligase [Streptomyces sp. CB01881]AUY52131.1 UDP-N-acetylmuramoyl-L-alanyl-D-glutamate--2,6-diaminopimelate ligase [Streptomyces sp. CB01881]TYC71559.1 UDP-N-acetylmuramoyl-L-alanyl-D-glutamate--2,6-diaminopimelate ligase [Streptomyces sp. CB01881]